MFELNESVSFLLSKCNQKAFALAQERLINFHLTPQQAVALTYLFQKDGINQLQLGEIIQKDRTTVSGIVNKLVVSGYVIKRKSLTDKRSSSLYITDKALSIKDDIIEQVTEVNALLLQHLSLEEQHFLIEILKKIRHLK